MKTKIFLAVLAFAMVTFTFMSNNLYSKEKSCCCVECKCTSCACAETCCKDNACSGCSVNNCCDENAAEKSCCDEKNSSGGSISNDSALVCVVSGEPIAQGKGVVINYMGTDYNVCCEDCAEGFKNEPIKFVKTELMCPIMNEPVKKNVSTVYEGTKYYFCCKMCIAEFNAEPNKYLKKESKTEIK